MTQSKSSQSNIRRRLEQFVNNPNCEANALSSVHGISMESLCVSEGLEVNVGISPFAFARGYTFEKALFAEDAHRLMSALKRTEVLPADASGFLDLRLKSSGGQQLSFESAHQSFLDCLRNVRKPPAIVAAPTFYLDEQKPLGDGYLAADVLTITREQDHFTLTIGEIKSYPDRGGYTDKANLAAARAQAGLYVHALERTIRAHDLQRYFEVAKSGFIVLSKPNLAPNYPRVRKNEDFFYQAQRAEGIFQKMREVALKSQELITEQDQERRLSAIACASIDFNENCALFCERAPLCRSRTLANDDPKALGQDIARLCGPISLSRSRELIEGAAPLNAAENDFIQRVEQLQPLRV